jgi:hypothetical protein
MKIDGYRFGKIVIAGREYTNDVIVFHNRVEPEWWRVQGHSLHREDLETILSARPHTLIVGCGAFGMMRVPKEIEEFLAGLNIRLIALRTSAAVREYNKHMRPNGGPSGDDTGVVGAFHLTC